MQQSKYGDTLFVSQMLKVMREKGITLQEIADSSDAITVTQLNRWRYGTEEPRISEAAEIAKALGVSLDWLCGTSYTDVYDN